MKYEKSIQETDIDSNSYDINFLNYDVKITIDKIKDLIHHNKLNNAFNINQVYNTLNHNYDWYIIYFHWYENFNVYDLDQ